MRIGGSDPVTRDDIVAVALRIWESVVDPRHPPASSEAMAEKAVVIAKMIINLSDPNVTHDK